MRGFTQRRAMTALAGLLVAAPVGASGAPVYDGVHTIQNVLTQLHVGAANSVEFAKQAARWAQQNNVNLAQLQQIARQLVGVRNYIQLDIPRGAEFQERSLDQDLESQCGESGSVVRNVLQMVVGSPMQSTLAQRQRQLCAYRVAAANMKYNNAVALLRRLQLRAQQLERLNQARARVGDRQGELSANDNDVAHYMAAATSDMNEWQASNQAFDLYIQDLDARGRAMTRQAFTGSRSIAGGLVQAATLKLALNHAKRD